MLSRALLLAIGIELAQGMEEAGVEEYEMREWCSMYTSTLFVPVDDVRTALDIETKLRELTRSAMRMATGVGVDEE
jgi:hypothetical protein